MLANSSEAVYVQHLVRLHGYVCLNSGVSHVSDRVTSCRAAAASPVHCGTRDDQCPRVAEESGGLAASALWTAKASIGGIITLDQSKKHSWPPTTTPAPSSPPSSRQVAFDILLPPAHCRPRSTIISTTSIQGQNRIPQGAFQRTPFRTCHSTFFFFRKTKRAGRLRLPVNPRRRGFKWESSA
ncbi:hypothetical protein KC324_g4 [Hortaea werneckii]|nr:hypothetical protein KC324_g4 [Hortaea werneckii]